MIFDTGLTNAFIPQVDFDRIVTTLRESYGITCLDADGNNVFKCECTSKQYDSLGDMHL